MDFGRSIPPYADSELVVAGEVGRVRRWPNWVSLLGKQDSLVDTYARAAVVINPVKFGTGLPVKTIEALSYGKPIVATSAGGRDLEDFSDAISVADDPDTFTGRVLELLECKDTRLKISQRALAAASEWQRHQLIALDAAIIGQKPAYPKEAPIARDDEILYNPARKSIHHNPARKSNSSRCVSPALLNDGSTTPHPADTIAWRQKWVRK